ncbi:MAG TPA: helix-turn-helix transcriptional regulator, partial [Acidimicrobiales bacterium]|nr:helix-turn-helix transcriptional regulator [Acidimicrobiales bacterium]
ASIALEHCGARLAAAEAAAAATSIHTASGLRRRAATSLDRASLLRDWCGPVSTPLLTAVDLTPLGPTLTTREREVAFLAAAGRTNREISEALGISLRTVHSHLNHAYTKLGTSDRGELLRLLGSPPAAATS